jgi:hypothetical protein
MNKKKPLNIALGLTISVVAVSLLGGKFLSSPKIDEVISTSSITEKTNKVAVKNDTLLSIQALANSGCESAVQLNSAELLALPQQQFMTHHSWSDKAETFSGPLLQDVLNTTCNNSEKIKLTALNDYAIDMDFNEVKKYQPIIALSVNGKRLSVREKGPLWVMLPLDEHKITDRSLDGIMIWQLSDIEILKANDEAS